LALAGCDGTISVTFVTGPQMFELSTAEVTLPPELDDGSGHIASVPCGPMGMCPPSDTITLTCESDTCDPAATTIAGPVGGVVDVGALLADSREVGIRRIDSYSVDEVAYEVTLNTLSFDVAPVDIYWGPEAATAIDPALGVHHFGTVPAIPAGATPEAELELDADGGAALSDYLVDTAQRVRFFAQTSVDLDPGDALPQGSLDVRVNVTMTAVGRVIM
jgi:hypothetical protein